MLEQLNQGRKYRPIDGNIILDISARSGAIKDATGRQVRNMGVTPSTAVMRNGNPSMYFNGSQYMTVPNTDGSLWFPGKFCIDFWFYLISKTGTFPTLFGNYDTWPNINGMQLFAGHNTSGANTNKFLAAIASTFPTLNTGVNIPYGSWHHYATERTANNVITNYIDGVANGTFTTSNALFGSKSVVCFGYPSDDKTSGGLNGYLDRVRITNDSRFNGPFTPPTF